MWPSPALSKTHKNNHSHNHNQNRSLNLDQVFVVAATRLGGTALGSLTGWEPTSQLQKIIVNTTSISNCKVPTDTKDFQADAPGLQCWQCDGSVSTLHPLFSPLSSFFFAVCKARAPHLPQNWRAKTKLRRLGSILWTQTEGWLQVGAACAFYIKPLVICKKKSWQWMEGWDCPTLSGTTSTRIAETCRRRDKSRGEVVPGTGSQRVRSSNLPMSGSLICWQKIIKLGLLRHGKK